jgi:uncharacterized protein YndB with AHSA1/START domain
MKWALIAGAVLVGLIALMAIVGAALPKTHVVSRSAQFQAQPAFIWAAITNVEAYPEWRAGVTKVEVLPHQPEKRWREVGSQGAITFEVAESTSPHHWVTRIADPKLPFGGSWTYQIAPSGAGSTLTITENGEVYNVFFRFLSRFVFGYTSSMDAWLNSLAKKSGEKITITSKS